MVRVLIVEDDLMIADLIEDSVLAGGYEVCGIARTVAEAVDLGKRHQPDLAVIDVRLAQGVGTEIAGLLGSADKFGILYATGNVDIAALRASDGNRLSPQALPPERHHARAANRRAILQDGRIVAAVFRQNSRCSRRPPV